MVREQAVTDAPCANFSEALIKAYPEAKVVLSLRDPDNGSRAWNVAFTKSSLGRAGGCLPYLILYFVLPFNLST